MLRLWLHLDWLRTRWTITWYTICNYSYSFQCTHNLYQTQDKNNIPYPHLRLLSDNAFFHSDSFINQTRWTKRFLFLSVQHGRYCRQTLSWLLCWWTVNQFGNNNPDNTKGQNKKRLTVFRFRPCDSPVDSFVGQSFSSRQFFLQSCVYRWTATTDKNGA